MWPSELLLNIKLAIIFSITQGRRDIRIFGEWRFILSSDNAYNSFLEINGYCNAVVKITEIQSTFSITYISSFVLFYREILSLLRWMEGMVVVYHAEDAKEAIPVLGFSSFLTSGGGVVGNQRKIHSAKVELAGQ